MTFAYKRPRTTDGDITEHSSGRAQKHIPSLWEWLIGTVGIIILLACSPTTSKAQSDASQLVTESPELRIASLEQNYDSQIITILSNYFNRKAFFVDVNINAEMVEETTTVRRNNIRQQRTPDVVMPGLPFLPEENRRPNEVSETTDSAIDEYTVRNLQLNNIAVNIYADTSLTSDDLEFMRLIAGVAAKINEDRGDQINITQIAMPNFNPPPHQVRVDSTQASSTSSDSDLLASLYDYLPGVLLLIILGLIIMVTRFYNERREQDDSVRQRDRLKTEHDQTNRSKSTFEQKQPNQTKPVEADSELEKLTNKFFTNPRDIKLLFESWAEEDQEEGIIKAAKVINSVDRQLIKSLKSELDDTYYAAIEHAAEELPTMTMEQKQEIAKDFNATLESKTTRSRSGKKRGQLPLLTFLDHISDEQIVQLINDTGPLPAALMLDYLSEEQAARLLDQLDQNKATNIMMKMMRIQELSYKQQKQISTKLYERAMIMQNQTRPTNYHSENIIPLLESLPLKKQRAYIEQLKATNPQVGDFIESEFITVDQIPELDNKLLQEAISSINTETLLDAVIGLNKSVTDKLLSVRPKREQRLIRMELDQINNGNEWDTDYAKSMLMNAIRQTARQRNR